MDVPDQNSNLAPEFQKCKAQISTKFGCIPLNPIYVYQGPSRTWDPITDVQTAHRLIKNTGIPNFWGLGIPVRTNLNVHSWRKYLVNYFD